MTNTKQNKKLTKAAVLKYQKVIDEYYVNKMNGRQAYKKYYPHVTDKTATENFNKICKHDEIKNYISIKQDEAAKIIAVDTEGVLLELKSWLELDITDTIGLTMEQIKELPPEVRRLITRHKNNKREYFDKEGNLTHTVETLELWFVSKEKAMEMVCKHIGFYEKDNSQKNPAIDVESLSTEELLLRASIIREIGKNGKSGA